MRYGKGWGGVSGGSDGADGRGQTTTGAAAVRVRGGARLVRAGGGEQELCGCSLGRGGVKDRDSGRFAPCRGRTPLPPPCPLRPQLPPRPRAVARTMGS